MHINFYLNWEEYIAAREFFRRNRQNPAPEIFRGGAVILLGAILYITGDLDVMAGVLALFGALIMFGTPVLRKWTAKRRWDREPLFRTEHKVAAHPEGIHFQMDKFESNLVWKYYQSFLESPDGFLLIYGDDSFNFLPKRAFVDENTIDGFRALLTQKLKRLNDQ
jgi:hypothetical protein